MACFAQRHVEYIKGASNWEFVCRLLLRFKDAPQAADVAFQV